MPDGVSPPELGVEGGLVVAFLFFALVTMAGDWVKPDLIFTTLLALYTACRFISVREAAEGFGNTGLLSVMALFAVAEGISQTGGLERVIQYVLGQAKSPFWVKVRMLIPVLIASAFLNNTPIVSLMIPIVLSWSRRNNMSPKAILLPLSYSAIFGGTCTLIGTSTNLVIAGFQQNRYADVPGLSSVGIFDISPYGIVYAVWGFMFLLFFGNVLLPIAGAARHDDLLVGMRIPKLSKHAGRTVAEAGLRNLESIFLISVMRQGDIIHAVGPELVLCEDDVLYFAGDLSQVEQFSRRQGLLLVTSESEESDGEVELGTSHNAPILGAGGKPLHLTTCKSGGSAAVREPLMPDASISRTASLLGRELTPLSSGNGYKGEYQDLNVKSTGPSRLLKCTLRDSSVLVGLSIRTAGFRTRFGASVVAVRRANKRLEGRLGDIVLEVGDVVLLDTGEGFSQTSSDVLDNLENMEYVDCTGEKEYFSAFVIPKGSRIAGKTVLKSGLRGMSGLFLVYVNRADGTQLHAVAPDTLLQELDTLWFAGNIHAVTFLLKMPGLLHTEERHVHKTTVDILERRLVQVVIAPHSMLIDQTVKDLRFRTKYDAAIVAVQRRGERVQQKIGDIALRAGDLLLLDTGPQFLEKHQDDSAFVLVSEVSSSAPLKTSKMWLALGLFLAMITTQIVQSFQSPGEPYINLWTASLLTSALMILTRCMNGDQARASMDWSVYMTIASAFGVSQALSNTNVADNIAYLFILISTKIGGQVALLSALYIATAMLSEILTNNAAAALMYPIASIAGDSLGVDPKMISLCLMLGASSSFMSPFGYQCNLMVYNAGNFKTVEMVKFGFWLQVWMWIVATVILGMSKNINILSAVSLSFGAVTLLVPFGWKFLPPHIKEQVSDMCQPPDFLKRCFPQREAQVATSAPPNVSSPNIFKRLFTM